MKRARLFWWFVGFLVALSIAYRAFAVRVYWEQPTIECNAGDIITARIAVDGMAPGERAVGVYCEVQDTWWPIDPFKPPERDLDWFEIMSVYSPGTPFGLFTDTYHVPGPFHYAWGFYWYSNVPFSYGRGYSNGETVMLVRIHVKVPGDHLLRWTNLYSVVGWPQHTNQVQVATQTEPGPHDSAKWYSWPTGTLERLVPIGKYPTPPGQYAGLRVVAKANPGCTKGCEFAPMKSEHNERREFCPPGTRCATAAVRSVTWGQVKELWR